jgi:hypothetical protein
MSSRVPTLGPPNGDALSPRVVAGCAIQRVFCSCRANQDAGPACVSGPRVRGQDLHHFLGHGCSFSQMSNSRSIIRRRLLLQSAQGGDGRVASSQPPPKAPPIRAELIGSDTCTAMGIIARVHSPVLALCRLLIEAGHNPFARLEAYRGSTMCLTVRSIGEGAMLRTATHGVGFERVPGAQQPRTSRKTPNPISDSRRTAAARPGASGASSRTTDPTKVARAARYPGKEGVKTRK